MAASKFSHLGKGNFFKLFRDWSFSREINKVYPLHRNEGTQIWQKTLTLRSLTNTFLDWPSILPEWILTEAKTGHISELKGNHEDRKIVTASTFQLHLPEIVTIFNQELHLFLTVLFSGTIRAIILEVYIRPSVSSTSLTARDHKVIENFRQHPCHVGHSETSMVTNFILIHVGRENAIIWRKSFVTATSI